MSYYYPFMGDRVKLTKSNNKKRMKVLPSYFKAKQIAFPYVP
jgi:hypothetical protein